MDRDQTLTRSRHIAGTGLIFLPGLALAMSAILKFAGVPGVLHTMAAQGFSDGKLTLVATLEIISAALFLFPRTRPFGVLLLSCFLGGAICTHVRMDEYAQAIGPLILLTLAWTGTWLRHPQALWSTDRAHSQLNQFLPNDHRERLLSKSA
jgi:DoxX-like family